MLRESAKAFEYDLEIEAVRDPSIDIGIPGGSLLLRLVDAVLTDSEPLAEVQEAIIEELGPEALLDAASVFGNFEMMNRVADASGIPIPAAGIEREKALVEMLELSGFLRH
ncbi:MAG: hypothetical protein HKN91_01775 [Acidimicrobiia bacterium]|nr:hypothetical protein [Acidimicrobiia bacterium]